MTATSDLGQDKNHYRMGNTVLAIIWLEVLLCMFGAVASSDISHGLNSPDLRAVVLILLWVLLTAIAGLAARVAAHGVIADSRGIVILQKPWLIRTRQVPWTAIERFTIGDTMDWPGLPSRGGYAVLRDGGRLRLTTITAAAVGSKTRRRAEEIVSALNAQLPT